MAKLIVTQPDGTEQILDLPSSAGVPFTIGRDPSCDLTLADKKLSRKHSALQETAMGRWTVRDLGSRNGTRKNGDAVGEEPEVIAEGDEIQLGNTRLALRGAGGGTGSVGLELETIAVEEPTLEPARGVRAAAPQLLDTDTAEFPEGVEFLLIVDPPEGEGARRTIPLVGGRLSLGKSDTCDLVLSDRKVSGVHAEIVESDRGGSYVVRDLGSTNGTRVAGRKVSGDGSPISHGDVISVGGTHLTFKHRDLPLDEDFLSGGAEISSVPRRVSRAPLGGLLLTLVLLGAVGGGLWFFLQDKRRPQDEAIAAPGDSLIQSGFSFEETKKGTAPEDYVRVRGAGAAAVSDVSARSGTRALQLIPDGELVVGPRAVFPVNAGDFYQVQLYAKTLNASTLAVQVTCYSRLGGDEAGGDGDFTHTAGSSPRTAESGSFEPLTFTFKVPRGSDHLGLELVARGEGQVLVDDVSLRKVTAQDPNLIEALLDGKYMGFSMDERGAFLVERLQEPLVQNGRMRLIRAGERLGAEALSGAERVPVAADSRFRWTGTFADSGGVAHALVASCRQTASGIRLDLACAPEPASAAGGGEGEPGAGEPGAGEPGAGEGGEGDPGMEAEATVEGGIEVLFETTLERVAGAIGVIGGETRGRLSGEFEEDEIFQIIFGVDDPSARCTLSIDPPATVRLARIDGRPTLRIRAEPTQSLSLVWGANFSTDPTRLAALRSEAEGFEKARQYGDAIRRYRTILQEFPFNEVEKARAEERLARLMERGEARVGTLTEQVDSTERLGHRNFKEAARRDILRMEREFAGTSFVEEVAPLRIALEEEMAAEDSARREAGAARLFRSGQDFLGEGWSSVARAKLEYCADEFGGDPDDPGFPWATRARELLESMAAGGEEN